VDMKEIAEHQAGADEAIHGLYSQIFILVSGPFEPLALLSSTMF
jgi:hypothetical protein